MYEYNINLFKEDSEFKYYFLGFVAADGYVKFNQNLIKIEVKKSDENLLKIFKDIICPQKQLSYRDVYLKTTGKYYPAVSLQINNKEIMDEIKRFILSENKTKTLIFPYGIPDKYVRHFIRGYSDGDGNIGVKKGQKKCLDGIHYYYGLRYRILGTRSFLQGLHLNLKVLLDSSLLANPHKKGDENVYYIEYGFSVAKKILDYLYKDSCYFLNRKKEVFEKIISLDSKQLEENYNTSNGYYNMQSTKQLVKE